MLQVLFYHIWHPFFYLHETFVDELIIPSQIVYSLCVYG